MMALADDGTALTVALVAGVIFVMVGIAARVSDFETAGAMMQDQPVVKAGKSTIFTTRQRLSRLMGRVSMISTLSPTLASSFSSWTCTTVLRLMTLW